VVEIGLFRTVHVATLGGKVPKCEFGKALMLN